MYHNFIQVLRREVLRICRRPWNLLLLTAVLLFCYLFFLSLMQEGQPEKLPIGIVDHDKSSLSREICHQLQATQGVTVRALYDSHAAARDAMQRQQIYAFLEIPEGAYGEVQALRAPCMVIYVNQVFLMPGSLAYRTLATVCNMVAGAVQQTVLRSQGMGDNQIMGLIEPIAVDLHTVSNPTTNYESYLYTTLLPGIAGLMILMITVYVIGEELKRKTSREWLAAANGDVVAALAGKLLPYTFWFLLLQEIGFFVLYGGMHFPLQGNAVSLLLSVLLFTLAMQATGIFLIGLIPVMRYALTGALFWGMWGFSLSGFSYPVTSMGSALKAVSMLFPLRYYYLIYVNEALYAGGILRSVPYLLGLVCFCLLPVAVIRRLKRAMMYQNYPLK